MATSARRRRNEWPSIEAAFDAYASKPPLNVMRADALHAYVDYGLRDRGDGVFELKCRPEVEAQIYAMAPNNGAFGVLPDVRVPVRVVCGETSTDISPAFGEQIAERHPHGTLEVMVQRGHFGPQEDPGCDRRVDAEVRVGYRSAAYTRLRSSITAPQRSGSASYGA